MTAQSSDARDTPQVEPQATVVVYRPDTGEIVSTHHFSTTAGVDLPGRDELEAIAFDHARLEEAAYEGELAALHVQPDEIQRNTVYRVSVEEGRLVEAPAR